MDTTPHHSATAADVERQRRNGDGHDGNAAHGQQPHDGHGGHDEGIPTDLPRVRTGAIVIAAVVALAAFAGLFLLGWMPRRHQATELREQTAALAEDAPTVLVTQPKRTDKSQDL